MHSLAPMVHCFQSAVWSVLVHGIVQLVAYVIVICMQYCFECLLSMLIDPEYGGQVWSQAHGNDPCGLTLLWPRALVR